MQWVAFGILWGKTFREGAVSLAGDLITSINADSQSVREMVDAR